MNNTKKGRPANLIPSKRIQVTLPQDDFTMIERICEYSGSKPATMIRELVNESRPSLLAMLEALDAHKNGTTPTAGSMADKMLKHALKGTDPTQQELLDLMEK